MAYTGAWKIAATNQPKAPLVQPIDPNHLIASPDDPNQNTNWIADTLVATLPDSMIGDQYLQMPTYTELQDYTPEDPNFGVGFGSGLTHQEWQDQILPVHDEDFGAGPFRRWIKPQDVDGTRHLDFVPDMLGDGTPTNGGYNDQRYFRGVGDPNDPNARHQGWFYQWIDRFIDRHDWNAEYRPSRYWTANTAPEQMAQPNGNQYTSPYPANIDNSRYGITSPDKFVAPQVRRVPDAWDEQLASDGIDDNDYGLTSWGL